MVSHTIPSVPASAIDWRSIVMFVSTKGKVTPQVFVTVSLTIAVPFVIPCAMGVNSISVGLRTFISPDAAGITSQSVVVYPPVIVASKFVSISASHIEIAFPRFKETDGSGFTEIVTLFVC